MGPQHIRDEILTWTRKKTAHSTAIELFIPVPSELLEILDATPSGHLTFLTTAFGKPFTAAGFGGWFWDQCNKAGLPHCTFHGLRKAAARRLAECGCTPHRHYWPRNPKGDRALHEGGKPKAARRIRNEQGAIARSRSAQNTNRQ